MLNITSCTSRANILRRMDGLISKPPATPETPQQETPENSMEARLGARLPAKPSETQKWRPLSSPMIGLGFIGFIVFVVFRDSGCLSRPVGNYDPLLLLL